MTADAVGAEELMATQSQLLAELPKALTRQQREFLLSLAEAAPDWSLMPFAHLREMPAIEWKLRNLNRLKSQNAKKFQFQRDELEKRLG